MYRVLEGGALAALVGVQGCLDKRPDRVLLLHGQACTIAVLALEIAMLRHVKTSDAQLPLVHGVVRDSAPFAFCATEASEPPYHPVLATATVSAHADVHASSGHRGACPVPHPSYILFLVGDDIRTTWRFRGSYKWGYKAPHTANTVKGYYLLYYHAYPKLLRLMVGFSMGCILPYLPYLFYKDLWRIYIRVCSATPQASRFW